MNRAVFQKKSLQFMLHCLVWLGLLAFPLLLVQSESRFNMRMLNNIWTSTFMGRHGMGTRQGQGHWAWWRYAWIGIDNCGCLT